MESIYNDIRERAESGGGQGGQNLDEPEAPGLRVLERLDHLLPTEGFVLDSGLVVTHSLDQQLLVILAEALSTHGRVRHVEKDKDAPEDRADAIGDEEGLP